MAVRIVAPVLPRYGNYTSQLLENFVARCDNWVPLLQISSSNAGAFCNMASAKKDDVRTQFYPLLDD